VRLPDLHHRRRHPADHPPDGDHAPVRLVRRIERDRELPAARLADAGLEPRERAARHRVNRGITRVATLALAMLVALIVGTTYWQVWAASSLADKQDNAIQRVAQFTVKRGKILGSHAKTIYATNIRRKVKGQTFYFRKYPNLGMLAQTVGYSTQERSR